MHAIVSLLNEPYYEILENLWRDLESECGLAGITLTPFPHFSWHISAEYDFKQLEMTMEQVAADTRPFTVRALGLGLFTGESPVIFIPLVKDAALADLHQCIWEHIEPLAIGSSPYYSPDAWVPHITLAHGDVDPDKLGCAMQMLAFRPFDWEIRVDHLALVYQLSGQVGKLQSKFTLTG